MPNYRGTPKEINPHYNREFELLMNGEKEIAVFSTGFLVDSDWPDDRYDLAITQGKLGMKVLISTQQNSEVKTVYYYRPNKENLVPKLEKLFARSVEAPIAFKLFFEEQIGRILGYSEEEIDC